MLYMSYTWYICMYMIYVLVKHKTCSWLFWDQGYTFSNFIFIKEEDFPGSKSHSGLQKKLWLFWNQDRVHCVIVYQPLCVGLILYFIFHSSHILAFILKYFLLFFALLTFSSWHLCIFLSFMFSYVFLLLFNCYISLNILKCLEWGAHPYLNPPCCETWIKSIFMCMFYFYFLHNYKFS